MTAKATTKTLSDGGTRFPRMARTASAKAISVAIGIPIPDCDGVPALRAKWIAAGATMPPTAANIGSSAFLMFDSSPL